MNQANKMENPTKGLRKYFKKGPAENFATILIALGVFMLMQPFSKWAFGYSFTVLLTGLVCFIVGSHFPEK